MVSHAADENAYVIDVTSIKRTSDGRTEAAIGGQTRNIDGLVYDGHKLEKCVSVNTRINDPESKSSGQLTHDAKMHQSLASRTR